MRFTNALTVVVLFGMLLIGSRQPVFGQEVFDVQVRICEQPQELREPRVLVSIESSAINERPAIYKSERTKQIGEKEIFIGARMEFLIIADGKKGVKLDVSVEWNSDLSSKTDVLVVGNEVRLKKTLSLGTLHTVQLANTGKTKRWIEVTVRRQGGDSGVRRRPMPN